MTTIALTGGIASGKTTISKRLGELGAVIIDADAIAHEVVATGTPTLAAIADRFGDDVLNDDGSLNRKALAAIVFNDKEALGALNDITHPEIRRVTKARIESIRAEEPDTIFIHDIPLLAENRSNYDYDEIWVADAPAEVRRQRLMDDRGMSAEEAQARIDAQASDEERRMIADVVIDTTQSFDETVQQVDELWARLRVGDIEDGDDIRYDRVFQPTPTEERADDLD